MNFVVRDVVRVVGSSLVRELALVELLEEESVTCVVVFVLKMYCEVEPEGRCVVLEVKSLPVVPVVFLVAVVVFTGDEVVFVVDVVMFVLVRGFCFVVTVET